MARPPFQFSGSTARFRDPDTGRWITRVQVRQWLDQYIAASQAKVLEASNALRAGQITLASWQSTMRDEIKDSHLVAEALARGGWNQLTPADFGRVGQRVRAQYRFLAAFTTQLRDGTVRLDGGFLARAKMYAASSRPAFYASQGVVLAGAGYTHERSLLHASEHCDVCVSEAERGWVQIGRLIPIGERTCLGNDRCTVEYQ
jgi:hypothetical protein